jgi:hypothetical protein
VVLINTDIEDKTPDKLADRSLKKLVFLLGWRRRLDNSNKSFLICDVFIFHDCLRCYKCLIALKDNVDSHSLFSKSYK